MRSEDSRTPWRRWLAAAPCSAQHVLRNVTYHPSTNPSPKTVWRKGEKTHTSRDSPTTLLSRRGTERSLYKTRCMVCFCEWTRPHPPEMARLATQDAVVVCLWAHRILSRLNRGTPSFLVTLWSLWIFGEKDRKVNLQCMTIQRMSRRTTACRMCFVSV